MKTLLFLLLTIPVFAQEKQLDKEKENWEYRSILMSDRYGADKVFCFFTAVKGEQEVEVRIKIVKELILTPIFITTNKGSFSLVLDRVNKNGFYIYKIFLRQKSQWKSINTGIRYIQLNTNRKPYLIRINSNLANFKNYAK